MDTIEIGYLHYIKPPCPFLVHGKCSVYDIRPMECRGFPFNFGTADRLFVSLWLDGICPNRHLVDSIDLIKALYITGQTIRLRLTMQSGPEGEIHKNAITAFEEQFLYDEHDRLQAEFYPNFPDIVSAVPINVDYFTQFMHFPLYTESDLTAKLKLYSINTLSPYNDLLTNLKHRLLPRTHDEMK